ncbi:MAG: DNA polymerase III subunit gamma/tau [Pseudomonadota bacterium]|nr:DNA polymerase III subunit gamma/tau [Pseudomonadota bacterium]
MEYQVLARKWRPKRFADMVGQQHVVQTLTNALTQQRLHHAYLFTGTRGVGKTTVARIIAKCLNCETGVTDQPCEQCSTCIEVNNGRFVDLIEVDAASNTKVEDTRAVLDNVQYAPSKGRYKVYLIDEVHMLSGHSFNALLKTLEEPPPHVKFLLATTDPQKLPVTVLSRCLQFHLKNLTIEQIAQHLTFVLQQENISAEAAALMQLGRAADGSMRDALSLLDQAIAFGDGNVSLASVQSMLGTLAPTHLYTLIESLLQDDAQSLFDGIQALAEQGADFAQALEELLGLLHQMALLQALPTLNSSLFADNDTPRVLAKQLTAEQLQLYYQIGVLGRRDLPFAPTPRSGFEMTLLRMLAFYPETHISTPPPQQKPVSKPVGATTAPAPAPAPSPAAAPKPMTASNWEALLPHLKLSGAAYAVAQHCTLISADEQRIVLHVAPGQAPMLNTNMKARFQTSLSEYYGKPLQVEFELGKSTQSTPAENKAAFQQVRQQQAETAIATDDNVQALLDTFNATIVPDSVEPTER